MKWPWTRDHSAKRQSAPHVIGVGDAIPAVQLQQGSFENFVDLADFANVDLCVCVCPSIGCSGRCYLDMQQYLQTESESELLQVLLGVERSAAIMFTHRMPGRVVYRRALIAYQIPSLQ